MIIAALAKAHKGPNKQGFLDLGITAATSRKRLLAVLHSTELALDAPPTLSPDVPLYMLTRKAQPQDVADRLRSWSRGKKTVKVRAEWTGSEWKLQSSLKNVEETLQQMREIERAATTNVKSASAFNGNLSAWNVSAVQDITYMFSGACVFNGNLSAWDVSAVQDMSHMFSGPVPSTATCQRGT